MWIFSCSIYTNTHTRGPKSCLCNRMTLFLFVCEIRTTCSVFNSICSRFNPELTRQAKSWTKQMWSMNLSFKQMVKLSIKRGRCRSSSLHLPRVAVLQNHQGAVKIVAIILAPLQEQIGNAHSRFLGFYFKCFLSLPCTWLTELNLDIVYEIKYFKIKRFVWSFLLSFISLNLKIKSLCSLTLIAARWKVTSKPNDQHAWQKMSHNSVY